MTNQPNNFIHKKYNNEIYKKKSCLLKHFIFYKDYFFHKKIFANVYILTTNNTLYFIKE